MLQEAVREVQMSDECMTLTPEAATGFLRMFRAARERAVVDAEDFQELLFAVERFGAYLHGKTARGLGDYASRIVAFAEPDSYSLKARAAGLSPSELMRLVQAGRNDYMHQGARARHLVRHAVALALVVEDALMERLNSVKHFMVVEVTSVEGWEPLARVRQLMLQNGFSFIPYRDERQHGDRGQWRLISESALARGLHHGGRKERHAFLDKQVRAAVRDGSLELEEARRVSPEAPVLSLVEGLPLTGLALVVNREEGDESVVGVISPFDLL